MARRENNFWRFAESQCELGLQDLRTRITKRITSVAPGASSPDDNTVSCRVSAGDKLTSELKNTDAPLNAFDWNN